MGRERRRAYGYVRVSKVGERGDDLLSPELQEHSIRTWAERNDVELVDILEDLDESGRHFEKRKVQRIIDDIRAGKAEMVVLWKWSRWGRNLARSQVYLAAVEAAGGVVRAAEEDFDPSTTTGKFTRDQMLLIAEFLSNQIGDQWKETHESRRRRGLPHTGSPRFGYTYDRGTGYTVDEELRWLVRDAYERFANGASMKSIAADWNERGLQALGGGRWNTTNLGRMLDTGFAAGLIRERSKPPTSASNRRTIYDFDIWREGAHEAIIPMELWEQYKARRTVKGRRERVHPRVHALTGLVYCGVCGRKCQSAYSGKHKRHTWICPEARDYKTHPFVSGSNRKLEQLVLAFLSEHIQVAEDIEQRAAQEEESRAAVRTDVEKLRAGLAKVKAKKKRLLDGWVNELYSQEEYDEARAELEAEGDGLERAVAEAERRLQTSMPEGDYFKSVIDVWERALPQERRELLAPAVARIELQPGAGWSTGDKAHVVPAFIIA